MTIPARPHSTPSPRGGERARGLLRVALLVLGGCAAPDPWEEARTACDLADGETLPLAAGSPDPDDGTLNGLTVSTACGEALLGHIGGQPAALLGTLGDDTDLGAHIEAVRTGALPIDGVTVAAWGLLWLAGADYGSIESLAEGPYSAQSWIDRVNEEALDLGLDADAPLGHVLYDTAAARIAGVAFLPDDAPLGATMGVRAWPSNVLHVPVALDPSLGWTVSPWRPDIAASSLYHEARHAGLDGVHHLECAPPARAEGRNCDATLDGAYGAGFLVAWSGVVAAYEGDVCVPAAAAAAVETAEAAEIDIRSAWENMLLVELPDSPFSACE